MQYTYCLIYQEVMAIRQLNLVNQYIITRENHIERRKGDWLQTCFFFFKKTLYEVKASVQLFSFNIFWYSSAWTCIKRKLYKVSDCWFRDMLNFDILKNGLRSESTSIFSATFYGFVYGFSRKAFIILYSINWSNVIF